ncbi:MAG: NYN domain-containing protein [Vicinamibacteria bacterium]
MDGNNLLGSWGGPKAHPDGRGEVVRRVAAFCRARGAQATIVFDGAPLRHDLEAQELGPVRLRVPKRGQDADSVIREIVETSARPSELIVVTSDKALYSYVKTRGARAMQAFEWNREERGAAFCVPAARRRARHVPSEKPDREKDVAGWLAVFGDAGAADEGGEPVRPKGGKRR